MTRAALACLVVLATGAALLAMGRREAPRSAQAFAVEQGVAGTVEVWEGNFMPMVNGPPGGSKTPATDRRVRVHEPFNAREAGSLDARQDTILTPLIAETRTDSRGQFLVPLEVGTYSIFVEDEGGWYFNGWDGHGFQGLIRIDSGKVTQQDIHITTKAVF
jgi:hypothetical protein